MTNGAGWFQINSAADNTRMSSSHAYLHPIIGQRPNLEIRTHCWVKRVAIEDRRATGVEYLTPDLLTQASVRARREVILSAGAIDTPKLLMLSGVGPGAHLQEFGIETLVDSPGVGANLDDHVEGIVQWDAKQPMIRTSTQWWEIGLFSTSEEGLDRPDLMMHYGSVPFDMNTARWGYPTTENGFCLTPNVCRGRSRGTVRLRSPDYRDRARVDPRYFTDPDGHDERVMTFGIRLARKIVSQSPMADWAGGRARARSRRPDRRRADRLHAQDPQHRLSPGLHGAHGAGLGPARRRRPAAARAGRERPARRRRLDPPVPARDQPVHHDDDDRREVLGHGQGGRASRRAEAVALDGERLNDTPAAPPEVTRFLRAHPPFDALEADVVERVAGAVEVEFHRAGTTIFSQGAEPVEHLRVVRSGAVEIVHDGRVLDLLGEGELFGHASMLSGLPTGLRGQGGGGHAVLPDRGGQRARAAGRVRPACASSPARCWNCRRIWSPRAREPILDPACSRSAR